MARMISNNMRGGGTGDSLMTAPAAIRQADIKRAVAGVVAGMRAAGFNYFQVGKVEVAPDGRIVVIGAAAAEWDKSD